MKILYDHHDQVDDWFWYYFDPQDIASRGDGSILVNYEALDMLERARINAATPLIINSAYRDPIYNAKIGGAPLSRHKYGDAFDISIHNIDKKKLIDICQEVGFTGFGVNYNTFLHVDCGRARQW